MSTNKVGVDPMAPGDVMERRKSALFTVNRSAMQQYKISLDRLSNTASYLILEEIFNEHTDIMDDQSPKGVDNLAGPMSQLIPNKHMVRNSKTWKSNLRSFSDHPVLTKCFEANECTNIPTCDSRLDNFNTLMKNQYEADPGRFIFKDAQNLAKHASVDHDSRSRSVHSQVPQKEKIFLNKQKSFDTISALNDNTSSSWGSDERNIESHESINPRPLVKSVFKTAREQLISSNPAAKRSLGTARKPQSKFVSPMMTENKESMETSEVGDERLKHIDPKMVELIQSEIIDNGAPIAWDDIAGLKTAKSVIQEAVVWPLLRPDIFTGLRRPPKGVLLFGPPGTGKTLIGKCVASQCQATFFNISASSLTSKWIGDGEKMVRALFAVAKCHQPAVIFIDEIDSLLTQRSDAEHEATRRIKTEFLVQFDGAGTGEEDRILIIGATNRPQELDEAARRRLVKRLYIPLPDYDARRQIVSHLMRSERHELRPEHVEEVCRLSEGYSGADMRALCSEAAMGPIRSVPLSQIVNIQSSQVRPVRMEDFTNALQRVRPSVSPDDLAHYVKWDTTYGHGC